MKPDEITRRLDLMGESYKSIAAELLPESEVGACMEAKNLAIQAVKLLEQVKAELRGDCVACKSRDAQGTQELCALCSAKSEYWEFRWPLGKNAAT